jgi:hypothetical protein
MKTFKKFLSVTTAMSLLLGHLPAFAGWKEDLSQDIEKANMAGVSTFIKGDLEINSGGLLEAVLAQTAESEAQKHQACFQSNESGNSFSLMGSFTVREVEISENLKAAVSMEQALTVKAVLVRAGPQAVCFPTTLFLGGKVTGKIIGEVRDSGGNGQKLSKTLHELFLTRRTPDGLEVVLNAEFFLPSPPAMAAAGAATSPELLLMPQELERLRVENRRLVDQWERAQMTQNEVSALQKELSTEKSERAKERERIETEVNSLKMQLADQQSMSEYWKNRAEELEKEKLKLEGQVAGSKEKMYE